MNLFDLNSNFLKTWYLPFSPIDEKEKRRKGKKNMEIPGLVGMHDQLVRSKIHYIISQWRLTQDSLSQSISFFWSLYNNMYHGTMPVVHDHLSYATSLEYFHVLFRAWSEQLSNQSMMHAWFTCENARIFCPPLTCIYTAIIVHLRKIYYY